MSGKEIARKITLAIVAGKASVWFEKLMAEKRLPLANIIGQATGYVAGATEFGEYIKFRGMFRGTNLQTGEVMDAPVCILPAHTAEMLRAALEKGDVRSVDFAFGVEAVLDLTSATKYVYKVNNLLPPAESDPLSAIEAHVVKTLALAAPAATADTKVAETAAAKTGGKSK